MARVDLDGDLTVGEALRRLGLECGRPVLVLAGSAANFNERNADRVRLIFEQVVAPICRATSTTVIYGGTRAGVMALLGEAMAEYAPDCVLLGVAPKALVRFEAKESTDDTAEAEPHHTHFVRTSGSSWGDESGALVGLAERIACNGDIVVLAIGGGQGTLRELDLAAERRWPVLLATGCGGKVDALAAPLDGTSKHSVNASSMMRRAIDDGLVTSIGVTSRHAARRLLLWRLSNAEILRAAWVRFAAMDIRAAADKPIDRQTKLSALGLGVLATLAAILATLIKERSWHLATLVVVTAAPLLASLMLVVQARQLRGSRWVSYRSAAEAIRREIFRFRTRAGPYANLDSASLQPRLAAALNAVDQVLGGRSAILARSPARDLWPPDLSVGSVDPRDALLDMLDGAAYSSVRVKHQLDYYSNRLTAADRTVARLLPVAFLAAAIATVFAALGFHFDGVEIWVALASSVGAAVLAWLDYDQTEQRAHSMATGAAAVRAAYERWLAAPPDQRDHVDEIARLADDVEDALGDEATEWNRALRQAERSFRG